MFLHTLIGTNKPLIDAAFALHREGRILPDTYIVDVDTFAANAKMLKAKADSAGVDLYFMSKQMGRNPHLCRILADMGYPGAVVVDYREAMVMMEHRIPIAHAGHLVQIPHHFLPRLIGYGVGMITVYSLEKAAAIDAVCRQQKKTQKICLRVVSEGDTLYPGQEGGVHLSRLAETLERLAKVDNVRVTALTAFPCFLYSKETKAVAPCHNLETVLGGQKIAEEVLGRSLALNLPSCTQTSLLDDIRRLGGKSAEPGSALIGTLPNNETGGAAETLAMAYVTEVSHNDGSRAYCYGGGLYPRGQIGAALVGKNLEDARILAACPPPAGNIDYYMGLEGEAGVGDCAVLCFRPQVFTSRSRMALLEGVSTGSPTLIGVYDAGGRAYES